MASESSSAIAFRIDSGGSFCSPARASASLVK